MSGRDGTITNWNELIEKLRERFLPPEGEMRVVGTMEASTADRERSQLCRLCLLSESAMRHGRISGV